MRGETEPVKTIPETFSKNGFAYRLIERTARGAIYSQTHAATGKLCAYEVIRIQNHATKQTPHFTVEAGEGLPRTDEWGRAGWTFFDLPAAKAKLRKIGLPSAIRHQN